MSQLHKYYKILELDKILEKLAEMTCCEEAANLARNMRPSSNLEKVKAELEKTDGAYILASRFGTPSFIRFYDPYADLKRATSQGVLNNRELLNVAAIYRQCRLLGEWRGRCTDIPTALDPYFNNITENNYLENRIQEAISSEEEINDNASPELASIRRKIRQQSMKAREGLDKLIRGSSQKYLQESIITMRDGRYVVPVKAEHRSEIPGLVHDTSSSGATLFVEPMSVVEANNQIRVLQSQEKEEIERILAELTALCADFAEGIQNNFRLILLLNLYFCKGNLGASMRGVKPVVSDDGITILHKARHPLIDKDKVVPIDVQLGQQFHSLIVTGPNTGGKTVTLKTLGLLTLMAMCGLMVPAGDETKISIYNRILVDIGDEQSIEQSLSTFSAHMTNIVSILKQADNRSLVLLDELGSGTDPVEGAALAISIIEEINQKGARLAATTHYAELKAYALQTEGVENACCEFDVATLQPTYRLLIGVPGRSNAFAISRRLGLKESILERAERYVSSDNRRFEDVVEHLEQTRQKLEKQQMELEQETVNERRLSKELEKKLQTIDNRAEKELERAREQAKYLVDSVRAQSDVLMNEIDTLRKQKEKMSVKELADRAKSQMGSRLNRLYEQVNPVTERRQEDYQLPRPLKVGDEVLVYDINKNGVVLALPDKKDQVLVQIGIMKSRIPLNNLRLLEQKKQKKQTTTTRNVRSNAQKHISTELDLRGCNAEEGILLTDRFIDSCVMSNIQQISIIHGKGTGTLRRAIQTHLKHHPSVKSYRLGVFGEGESGVTIVELK